MGKFCSEDSSAVNDLVYDRYQPHSSSRSAGDPGGRLPRQYSSYRLVKNDVFFYYFGSGLYLIDYRNNIDSSQLTNISNNFVLTRSTKNI